MKGEKLKKKLLLKVPAGGIPGVDIKEGSLLLALVPIYGTKDAGRRFYKTFRRRALEEGLVECKLCRSMYTYRDQNGRNVIMAGAHVDDIMWAADPEHDKLVTKALFQYFTVKEIQTDKFRFCGREYRQDEYGNIWVVCKDNTEKIKAVRYDLSKRLSAPRWRSGAWSGRTPRPSSGSWTRPRPERGPPATVSYTHLTLPTQA